MEHLGFFLFTTFFENYARNAKKFGISRLNSGVKFGHF
jgi:hypothetical protein